MNGTCTASGDGWACSEQVYAKDFCRRHYDQAAHGSRLTPADGYSSPQERSEATIEDVEFMLSTGRTIEAIGEAAGKRPASLVRYLYRWGRPDLARACNPLRITRTTPIEA